MGRVPVYEQQVLPNALPGARMAANANGESFGGAQARQLGQAGNALFRAGNSILDWANRPAVKEAEQRAKLARANDALNKAYDRGREISQEVYSLKGLDSTKVLEIGNKRWQEARQQMFDELADDEEVRQIAMSKFDPHANDQLARLSEQQIRNVGAYEKEVQTARLSKIADQSAALIRDSGNLEDHAALIENTRRLAEDVYKDDDPELRAGKVAAAQRMVVARGVEILEKAQDYAGAIKFLERYKDNADPATYGADIARLQDANKNETMNTEAREWALKMLPGGEVAALADIRKTEKDPEKARLKENYISHMSAQDRAAKAQAREDEMAKVRDQVFASLDPSPVTGLAPDLIQGGRAAAGGGADSRRGTNMEEVTRVVRASNLSRADQDEVLNVAAKRIEAQLDGAKKVAHEKLVMQTMAKLESMSVEQLQRVDMDMLAWQIGAANVAPYKARRDNFMDARKGAVDALAKTKDQMTKDATALAHAKIDEMVAKGEMTTEAGALHKATETQRIRDQLNAAPVEKLNEVGDNLVKLAQVKAIHTIAAPTSWIPVVRFAQWVRGSDHEDRVIPALAAQEAMRLSGDRGSLAYSGETMDALNMAYGIPTDAKVDQKTGMFVLDTDEAIDSYLDRTGQSRRDSNGRRYDRLTVNAAGVAVTKEVDPNLPQDVGGRTAAVEKRQAEMDEKRKMTEYRDNLRELAELRARYDALEAKRQRSKGMFGTTVKAPMTDEQTEIGYKLHELERWEAESTWAQSSFLPHVREKAQKRAAEARQGM